MKKFLLTAGALATLFVGPAMAADLARPPLYAPIPVVVPMYTWTGCFFGGNGGGLWVHRDWTDPAFGAGDFGSHTASGGLGGVQAGCNYQVGHWVLGSQGDWDWAKATGTNTNAVFPLVTDQSQATALASVTMRTGFARDRFFGYVRGGGAWLKSDYSLQFTGAAVATVSQTRQGWTLGVGGEYAFLDWLTGFIEYDYYNFRSSNNNFICTTCGFVTPTFPVSISTTVNLVKAGLNFKIGPNARW
jgi:outer membrane immunogenic protein